MGKKTTKNIEDKEEEEPLISTPKDSKEEETIPLNKKIQKPKKEKLSIKDQKSDENESVEDEPDKSLVQNINENRSWCQH